MSYERFFNHTNDARRVGAPADSTETGVVREAGDIGELGRMW